MKYGMGLIIATLAFGLSGCSTLFTPATTTAITNAVKNPNNEAKAAQEAIAAVGVAVVKNNPSYAADFVAVGDALAAAATASAGTLTSADFQAILGRTKLQSSVQGDLVAAFNVAQSTLMTDFAVTLPTFKPIYALWLTAVANGFYTAGGHAQLPLPVVPYTPATVPTATAVGTAVEAPAPAAATPATGS